MKAKLKILIQNAARAAYAAGAIPSSEFPEIVVEVPKVKDHGDFSTNLAMTMARQQKMAPRKIAEYLLAHLDDRGELVAKSEIAGPGFINFFLNKSAWIPVLKEVHHKDDRYGESDVGRSRKIQVEFVSSNPTGPLHVGHGRGAAVGDSIANILAICGWDVQKEYYINDSGRQIQTLGRSVYYRMKELAGEKIEFPDECYQGVYIRDLAQQVIDENGSDFVNPEDDEAIMICARFAAGKILDGIRADLETFGVNFDQWFSEQSLYDSGKVDEMIASFKDSGRIYAKDEALWFNTTDFGDEKDRVVVRSNGQTTYFASDIAYHQEKYERGFERVIDVWGADHHGYIPRVSGAIQAHGYQKEQFDVILVQLVNLLRAGEPVAMSTRAGEFVTLSDVVDEVGADAARFIFLTRSADSPLDFDLELAKQKTNDNPVYYVQYVHARIASILRKAGEQGLDPLAEPEKEALSSIEAPEEIDLMKLLARYPEALVRSADLMEPHRVTYFLMDLASAFHTYYNKHKVLGDDSQLTTGRLYLVRAVQKVIRNGLGLLGVSAPDSM
ncbi:MAG: Arginyl-tRNA synthetase (EC 6.1.1.19) [Olavius algarvensis Delta 4 endosymbiont]|nr:MAG: Arginyl-tRNA synthetase (EC 6.1.1.19) [Olavius algarvensis Delta 4 endosymbiont]